MNRLLSFAKEHWYETLLYVLSAGGAVWTMSLIGQIADMAIDYPLPLGVLGGFIFLMGLLLSYLLGIRDTKLKKLEIEAEERRQETVDKNNAKTKIEAEEAKRIKKEKDEVSYFRKLDFTSKIFLFFVYKEAPFEEGTNGYSDVDYRQVDRYIDKESISNGTRYYMKEWAHSFLDKNDDLFDCVREHIEKFSEE